MAIAIQSKTKKMLLVFFIFIALSIALSVVSNKIDERSNYRDMAFQSVSESWTKEQTLMLPVLVIPYEETITEKEWNKSKEEFVLKETKLRKKWHAPLISSKLNIDLQSQILQRGLFNVPVYTAQISLASIVDAASIQTLRQKPNIKLIGGAFLSVVVSDQRGLVELPKVFNTESKQSLNVKAGSGLDHSPLGFSILLPPFDSTLNLDIRITMNGMSSMQILPTAKDNQVEISSPWNHPKFIGSFLPQQRNINQAGYQANWQVSELATGIESMFRGFNSQSIEQSKALAFGVRHIQPVDHYVKSDRSVKYGWLIVALVFMAMWIYELLGKANMTLLHYALIGAALVIFYVLLLGLSEHLSFSLSYFIAVVMSSCIIIYYLSNRSIKKHLAYLWVGFCVLYSLLYFIISSEDYALVSGAILLFLCLFALMASTKSLNQKDQMQTELFNQ